MRSASCLSNEKQIGLAMMQYAQDFDEALPAWNAYYASPRTWPADDPGAMWHARLQPYIKSGQYDTTNAVYNNSGVWHCPDAGSQGEWEYFQSGGKDTDRYAYSYGYNAHVSYTNYPRADGLPNWSTYNPNTGVYRYPILSEMDAPASTIYIGDGGGYNGRIAPPYEANCYNKRVTTGSTYPSKTYREVCWEVPDRHQGGANYVFVDGHAKYFTANAIYPIPANAKALTAEEQKRGYRSAATYFAYDANERRYFDGLAQ